MRGTDKPSSYRAVSSGLFICFFLLLFLFWFYLSLSLSSLSSRRGDLGSVRGVAIFIFLYIAITTGEWGEWGSAGSRGEEGRVSGSQIL